MPALSTAFLNKTSEPLAFGSIIGSLGEGQHLAAFTDPNAAQSDATAQKGADALGHLFGSPQVSEEIVRHASSVAGLSPDLLRQMLPVVASMVMGGIMKSLQNQGWGGVFSQLANAAGQGGLGALLGNLLGGAQAAGNPQSAQNAPSSTAAPGGLGGWGGIFGSILGSFLSKPGVAPPPQGGAAQPPSFDATSIQAGLEALIKMFQPGTPPSKASEAGLQSEIGQILDSKRR